MKMYVSIGGTEEDNFEDNSGFIDDENKDEEVESEEEEDEGEEDNSDRLPENSYLKTYFEDLQARLARGKCPAEYERGTFWIEPLNPFFALKNGRPVNTLYQPRVFLWLPHYLLESGLNNKVKNLKCHKCKSSLEIKGFNKDPHARRIVDLSSYFYLMSTRYRCSSKTCPTTLNAHNHEIIEQLPLELQMEFPAILTANFCVSKTVADLLRPCMQNSVGP
ncbi:hypothetical protein [Parasitella parasitica]|uniref:DUF6729 domain-containing protein n=1 Tax=Parasitella parasitica TaxID=35722 RepID=A0A0B7MYT9_9FUNG|nr:hypothetical protein [Parasitella parasitica]